MTIPTSAAISPFSDQELVTRTLAGDREAYRRIVERYQALVCSVAYSSTGDLAHSEDVAQETFVAAWRQLRQLREPGSLRSWLCGIARNLVANRRRQLATEPSHAGSPLPVDAAGPEPLPSEAAVRREQEAILWQALAQIPELYREPLILFYREHQSVERVAVDLGLTEDVVRQRLSRGRKLLHQEVARFVEGTLTRTAPGASFTLGVMGALPLLTVPGGATAAAWGAASPGCTAGLAAKLLAFAQLAIGPVIGLVAAWLGIRASLRATRTPEELAFVRRYLRRLLLCLLAFCVAAIGITTIAAKAGMASPRQVVWLWVTLGVVYLLGIVTLALHAKSTLRRLRRIGRAEHPEAFRDAPADPACWNYRSRASLFGLPLVHVRFGGEEEARSRPVVGWIAGGEYAIGIIAAFGGVTLGAFSAGGISAGVIAIGGVSLGLLSLGGLAIGAIAIGGLAIGIVATGGVALAGTAALGGYALSREFAVAAQGSAPHLNDALAQAYFAARPWLDLRTATGKAVLSLAWLPALFVIWQHWPRRAAPRTRSAGAE
ncbi:sigma-70 family RNA polymerase sigma factor [Opitutus sp. ER46]|uniref:RNA polymerase sigma factor n=1 Tax=Opitutus sp. ER46 TaxID=2161864 RepID=UPI001304BAD9|nr:sigma-70 family RNA polymerase sigma factor [Opitutus sp. ER46]